MLNPEKPALHVLSGLRRLPRSRVNPVGEAGVEGTEGARRGK